MLARFHHRIEENRTTRGSAPVLIVALGDSVTQGCMELDQFDFDAVYHAQLKRMLEQRWPLTTFSVINAGVAGESAPQGLVRVDRDVIRHQPDLVLVAFGLNDACCDGPAGIVEFDDAIRQIIQRTRDGTTADLILLTPPMMAAHDNSAVHEKHRHLVEKMTGVQNNGILADFAERLRATGHSMNVAVADVHAAWREMADRGIDTTAFLANGLNHPNAAMHRLAAEIVFNTISAHTA